MKVLDDFHKRMVSLAEAGWNDLFKKIGLDLNNEDKEAAFLHELTVEQLQGLPPGFSNLAPGAKQLIKPGNSARSILFHALNSPEVTMGPNGRKLSAWPEPADLESAENAVFALARKSLEDVKADHPDADEFAVVVFAQEYRDAGGTSHGRHADMTWSRTGVARVGTLPPAWDGERRAFLPLADVDDIHQFRVLPCRYGAYIAKQQNGLKTRARPYRWQSGDNARKFWILVHKLFSGSDCLVGIDLDIKLDTTHFNEKLKRIHMSEEGSGHSSPEIDTPPFLTQNTIAKLSSDSAHGGGLITPIPKPRLVEPIEENIGFNVNEIVEGFNPTYYIPSEGSGARKAPEYVHIRSVIDDDGEDIGDLYELERPDHLGTASGNEQTLPFRARHYTDFTGDGWVSATTDDLPSMQKIAAYSLIAPPDFFPYVDQALLKDWAEKEQVTTVHRPWFQRLDTLADQRDPANVQLRDSPFSLNDDTVSAIVGRDSISDQKTETENRSRIARVSTLPDAASGIYAPGWDISIDSMGNRIHMAAHGLGSPFPEDVKLCAVLSAYWPAATPDTARLDFPIRPTTAPLTDSEMGLGNTPSWDGVQGPEMRQRDGKLYIVTENFDHLDYVRNCLEGKFTLAETMKTSQSDYQARILATDRMYRLIGSRFMNVSSEQVAYSLWLVSFTQGGSENIALAEEIGLPIMNGLVHRFVLALPESDERIVERETGSGRWLRFTPVDRTFDVLMNEAGMGQLNINNQGWQLQAVG